MSVSIPKDCTDRLLTFGIGTISGFPNLVVINPGFRQDEIEKLKLQIGPLLLTKVRGSRCKTRSTDIPR